MKNRKQGQAIIEAVIALSVLTVGFLGIVGLLSRSLSAYRVTNDNYTANYLAAEGIEVVKNILDADVIRGNGWGESLAAGEYELDYGSNIDIPPAQYTGKYLLFDDITGLYQYDVGAQTKFQRKIIIENVSADEIKVNAIVDWIARGGGKFSITVEDHFFNWR